MSRETCTSDKQRCKRADSRRVRWREWERDRLRQSECEQTIGIIGPLTALTDCCLLFSLSFRRCCCCLCPLTFLCPHTPPTHAPLPHTHTRTDYRWHLTSLKFHNQCAVIKINKFVHIPQHTAQLSQSISPSVSQSVNQTAICNVRQCAMQAAHAILTPTSLHVRIEPAAAAAGAARSLRRCLRRSIAWCCCCCWEPAWSSELAASWASMAAMVIICLLVICQMRA